MTNIRDYDVTFRPNYELRGGAMWIACGGASVFTPFILSIPAEPYLAFTAVSVAMAIRRLPYGLKLLKVKKRINGTDLTFINLEELKPIIERYSKTESLWLGYGWEWENKHSQLLYETSKRSEDEFMDKSKRNPNQKGAAWLHGLNPDDIEISQPLSHTAGHTLIVGTTGSGKSQPLYSKVLSIQGWKTMGSIAIGDEVVCPDGKTAKVDGIFPQGVMDVYEITFEDGRKARSSSDHLWETINHGTLTTLEIIEKIRTDNENHYTDIELYRRDRIGSVDPVRIPLSVPTIPVEEKSYSNIEINAYNLANECLSDTLAINKNNDSLSIQDAESLSISASAQDRMLFIKGILSLSAESVSNHCYRFKTPSKRLALASQDVIRSLGGKALLDHDSENNVYTVLLTHKLMHLMDPYAEDVTVSEKPLHDVESLKIESVVFVGQELTQCIHIDHPDHLYITDDYVVTHNTRMFDQLITQAIMRGDEAVVIIDPKGDKELRENARLACKHSGDESRFFFFHPSFPELSVRLDPLRNFNRPTELASRIAVLMNSENGSPFQAYGQMSINNVVQGILSAGERPNLVKIRGYLEGGVEYLVVSALQGHFDKNLHNWDHLIGPYMSKASTPAKKAEAVIRFYREHCKGKLRSPDLEGLLSMYEHDKAHFSKMIASLLPIMNQLTSGELGSLLSPDSDDVNDDRKITDSARVIRNNQVLYVGLDSLSDAMVGQAIGSIILSDLTAVAGDRYNYGLNHNRVNIYVDEVSEVINLPLIQTLNKGRGAGYNATLATQTFADFAAALGDANKARQVLGNINNIITLRVTDAETQQYICDSLPKVRVKYVMQTQGTNSANDTGQAHSGNIGERLMEEEVEMIPPQILGKLPDLEFFARLVDGRLMKGRIPILTK